MKKKKISIVAGDMVGFSRLIEEDEINTLKRQKKNPQRCNRS